MGHGGARPGAGKPKGHKSASTLDKEMARARLRELVMAAMDPLVAAQIANAQGIKFLMVREKTSGKFVKVGKDAAEKLDPTQEIIEVWEKDPSVQAFTDLMNRTLDKPTDHIEQEVSGDLNVRWMTE